MIGLVKFENFKALKNNQIKFGKLTVLAGLNSAGKSSVIQGLLLLRSLAESCEAESITELLLEPATIKNFPLNGNYLLSLGSTKEAISKDTGREFVFTLTDNKNTYVNRFSSSESLDDKTYKVDASPDKRFPASSISRSDFYYLNAERLGPRIRHWINERGNKLDCGFRGEFTVEVLARTRGIENEEYRVIESKILNEKKLPGFQDIPSYTAQWMEFITPGTSIGYAEVMGQIRSASIDHNGSSPPNVGFGISYVLPIIVTGLLAKPGSIIIVENPEAHLHPKGQSNIGFFLGQMAASGIQIIVETHSEHVINGIRKAALSLKELAPENVCLSFFKGVSEEKEAEILPITLSKSGDLIPFPKDFFDQVQQDLAALYQLNNPNKTDG